MHITNWLDSKGIPWCNEKLDYGDYTLKFTHLGTGRDIHLQDICCIERKANLEELSGNLTHNRERFEREFMRSKGKVYLLLESSQYDDIERGNYNTKFNKKAFRSSLTAFEQRFNLHTVYLKDTAVSGYFIYTTLTGALTEILKKGEI